MENTERQEIIDGIRAMVEFFEANPDLKIPFDWTNDFNLFVRTKEQVAEFAKALGTFEKRFEDGMDNIGFQMHKKFGPVRLCVVTERSTVCEKVVLGTEEVPETVIPATPEKIIPAYTKEITEWRCEPILSETLEVAAV